MQESNVIRFTKNDIVMKHLFTILTLVVMCASKAFATTYIVNNNTSNPGQFYYLQAAIDSADTGDTLYIQPSPVSYGDASLYKGLTLIGIGFKPIKDFPSIASIGTITMSQNLSGATFIGLKIGALMCPCNGYGDWHTTANIHAINCDLGYIGDSYSSSCYGFNIMNNIVVENCIVRNISLPSNGNNFLFQNNVIYAYSIWLGGSSTTNVTVKNNLFIYDYQVNTLGGNAVVFENNIFYRFSPYSGSLTNCVFNNNLTYATAFDEILTGTNTGINNIIAQDPLFVNYVTTANPAYNPLYNYRLQELSPAHNAGTDGTDIGPYGNNITFSETGENVQLPVIRQMNLLNSTVPSSGILNVQIKATSAKTE